MYHIGPGNNTNIMQLNNERIQYINTIISSLRPGLYGDDPSPRLWYGIVEFNVPFDTV